MTVIDAPWLTASATQSVLRMLTDAGHQAYAVGGCVRNTLMGVAVSDVDIATDARPDVVTRLAEYAALRAVPTGMDHGTVTVVADGTGYEVTTFRADVQTDGRRAVVQFSNDLAEDAARRDFTMNALYVDADGTVIDPLGGLPDLHARRVRFIQNPTQRIREDYLRILRFFRFNAWYGDPDQGLDADALAAIADNLDGLDQLSRERVGSEVTKLLSASDPSPAIAAMHHAGVLAHCLPGAVMTALAPLVHLEGQADTRPNPMRRLAAIGFYDGAALRLSKADQRRLGLYQTLIGGTDTASAMGYRHGYEVARDVILLRAVLLEQPFDPGDLDAAKIGAQAVFPVSASDLMPEWQGAALGKQLTRLEDRWIASGFAMTRTDLLG